MTGPVAPQLEHMLRPLLRGGLPVRLTAWDGSVAGSSEDPDAPRISVNSPDALRRLLWHPGELGAAQAYVAGELDIEDDIAATLSHVRAVAEERGLSGCRPRPADFLRALRAAARLGFLGLPLPPPATQSKIGGRLRALRRDRTAISPRQDLSPDFFATILDPSMSYSCGYFTRNIPGTPQDRAYGIEQAQRDKLDLVCRKVGLGQPGMRLLDVGCGWGALSIHAAAEFDAQVVGVTNSRKEKAFADKRIAELGLGHRIEIRLQDYSEITDDPFDAVVTLEMGEHVGEADYPHYARTLHDNAKPGARVLIQQMSRTGKHPGGGPFIESFITPDMTMRPVGETVSHLESAGLEVRDVQSLREHYVWTVSAWLDSFEAHWSEIVAMVGVEMARVWRLYLVGGRLSFEQGRMGVDQLLAVRPTSAGRSAMPAVRGDLPSMPKAAP